MLEWILPVLVAGIVVVLERITAVMRRQARLEAKVDAVYGLLSAVMEGVHLTAEGSITQSKLLQEMSLASLRKQ